jgi:hypothetical protein
MIETTKRVHVAVEPLTEQTVAMVARSVGMFAIVAGFNDVDRKIGCGIHGDKVAKCMWRLDGKRIDIEMIPGGGLIASVTDKPDPFRPTVTCLERYEMKDENETPAPPEDDAGAP